MARAQLRVYYGPEKLRGPHSAAAGQDDVVQVRLGEILPLLADAVNSQRTWLRDFSDDQISISTDLHEVLLAYQHCRRPSA